MRKRVNGENSLADELRPWALFIGAVMAGSLAGGWLFLAVTGHAEPNLPLGGLRHWSSISYLVIYASAVFALRRDPILRNAFGVGLVAQLLSLATPIGGPGWWPWVIRELLHVLMAGLLLWGGRVTLRHDGRRLGAAALFVAVLVFRYWSIKNWYDIVNPPSLMRGL